MEFSSLYGKLNIPENISIPHLLLNSARSWPDRICMVDGITGQYITYIQMVSQATNLAHSLWHQGVRKGDVVLMCIPNSIQYPVIILAILKLGATCSPSNPRYTTDEIWKQVEVAGAKFLFINKENLKKIKQTQRRPIKVTFVTDKCSGYLTYDDLIEPLEQNAPEIPEGVIDPVRDAAFIPFSSGTTGHPKGVLLSHFNIVANIIQHCHPNMLPMPEKQEVYVALPPMYHVFGLTLVLMLGLYRGAKIITLPGFSVDSYLHTIQRFRATHLHVVPSVLVTLSNNASKEKYDLSSVQYVWSGGAPLSDCVARNCKQQLGIKRISQGYGMTETSPGVCMWHLEIMPQESVGVLLPNTEAKVVDTMTGKQLGFNEKGELYFRGPQVTQGYLNDSSSTNCLIGEHRWLQTGDIGYIDENNNFFIVDRAKELIKYKGTQVAPAELEDIILSHTAIADAAVIGRPDLEAGELPMACVVLKQGHHLQPKHLQTYIAERVAPYKRLRGGVVIVPEIPKSPSGKILRRILKEKFRSFVKSQI